MNAQEFNALASDTTKNYRLEAFSFTFDFGLNIYFDDYEDLKNIIGESEIEFWQLEILENNVEIEMSSFHDLNLFLDRIENGMDVDQYEMFSTIVSEGYATWENVESWHEDNYFSEKMDSDYDFGHYLMHDINCIEIPDTLQGYIDYEQYGKDALINDFVMIGSNIYNNR